MKWSNEIIDYWIIKPIEQRTPFKLANNNFKIDKMGNSADVTLYFEVIFFKKITIRLEVYAFFSIWKKGGDVLDCSTWIEDVLITNPHNIGLDYDDHIEKINEVNSILTSLNSKKLWYLD